MQIELILVYFQFSLPFPIFCQRTYECGSHGRFEYCIDEIPGCVIGCHCHPGYYFDTDTKICESNSKIIAYHRRNNVIQPTRETKTDVTPNVIYDTEFLSTTNKVDSQVDEITKDANDLGDWLYNQFFKTIENQVINETNDKDVFTRRSGSHNPIKTNYIRKKGRNLKSSKQWGKKKHLKKRKKLLRITENDSLFDLSSKSSSDSSDSSSSDSSMEYETNEYNQKHDDDDEHGHKKIVMINKKPKQQLASFIFLPNLDTPFYPPIGLPPPPIIPMYPIVPIPPVTLCPEKGCDENKDKQITSMTVNITSTTTARSGSKITNTSFDELESTTVTKTLSEATDAPNSKIQSLRVKNKKKKKKGANISSTDKFSMEQGRNNLKAFNRQKILQRLKENMNNPSANLFMPSWKRNKKILANTFVNQNANEETPFLDNKLSEDTYMTNEIQPKQIEEDSSFPDNVDFKYITELIHRVDLTNKSNNLPPIEYNPNNSIEMYRPSKIDRSQFATFNIPFNTPNNRRLNHPTYHHRSDEAYYTNLGRQIAKMIRGNPQFDQGNIRLDETDNKGNNVPYLNTNSAKSFWERSVRSPLTLLNANNKKFEYMKKSNELLFDIENKVEIIASTSPPLSLQEIENIVNVMEATKRHIQYKDKQMSNLKSFDKNPNIDLWPEHLHKTRNNFQNTITSLSNKDWERKPIRDYKNINQTNQSVRVYSIEKLMTWNGQNVNKNAKAINQSSVKQVTVKPLNKTSYFEIYQYNNNKNKPYRTHDELTRNREITEKHNPFLYSNVQQSLNQQMNPSFLEHRKYFQDNNNYYGNQNVERIPSAVRFSGIQPSYFHREINYFDYMP